MAFAGESFGEVGVPVGVAEGMATVGVADVGHIGDWVGIGLEPVVGLFVGSWISLQALRQCQHRVLHTLFGEDGGSARWTLAWKC